MAVFIAGYTFFMVMFIIMAGTTIFDRFMTKRNLRKTAMDRVVNFL